MDRGGYRCRACGRGRAPVSQPRTSAPASDAMPCARGSTFSPSSSEEEEEEKRAGRRGEAGGSSLPPASLLVGALYSEDFASGRAGGECSQPRLPAVRGMEGRGGYGTPPVPPNLVLLLDLASDNWVFTQPLEGILYAAV